jgi:hypothetical protein
MFYCDKGIQAISRTGALNARGISPSAQKKKEQPE